MFWDTVFKTFGQEFFYFFLETNDGRPCLSCQAKLGD
jgi:hypothetical protein